MKRLVILVLILFAHITHAQSEPVVHFIRPYDTTTGEEAKTPIYYTTTNYPDRYISIKDLKRLNYYGEPIKSSEKCLIIAYLDVNNQFVQTYYYEPIDTVFDVPVREAKLSQKTLNYLIDYIYQQKGKEPNLKNTSEILKNSN